MCVLTCGCCVAAFVSFCDQLHIRIALTIALTRMLCTRCLNRKTCHHDNKLHKYPVRFVFVFASRFQSFRSVFGSLVSIPVWIYFNRLQNPAAMELNYFVFLHAAIFCIRESPSRALWLYLFVLFCFVLYCVIYPKKMRRYRHRPNRESSTSPLA